MVGLLVRDVQPASRADEAGTKVGDVLIRADNLQLRSITTLYAAINQALPGGTLNLQAIRGEQTPVTISLDLRPRLDDALPLGNASPPSRAVKHHL